VSNDNWDIGLPKTGFINEAGRCLVMQAVLAGRNVVIVLLDSWGKYARMTDALRIRSWMEGKVAPVLAARKPSTRIIRLTTLASTGRLTKISVKFMGDLTSTSR